MDTDQAAIERYLENLFGSTQKAKKITKTPLQNLRDTMGKGFDDMLPKRFDEGVLKWCIKGLLKQDLFAGKKREALLDLQDRTTVLKEMADVLNMDLESLDSWNWEPSPVPMHIRRQVNGKYRVFMDEEINQAILLHFIGAKWAVHMKKAFSDFFHSGAWLQAPFRSMSKKDRQRREYFLGQMGTTNSSVRNCRRKMYKRTYFMTHLPSTVEEGSRDYGDLDVEPDVVPTAVRYSAVARGGRTKAKMVSAGPMRHRRILPDSNDLYWDDEQGGEEEDEGVDVSVSRSPLAIKQSVLHLATTELLLNTKLYGQFTIVQSDFKWFGVALPHSTIFSVLKFLGVTDKWLNFFKKYLTVPLVFAQDGPGSQPQPRIRGVPMAHVLSDALGEAVLFCLDFAVNQQTKGANLYRFHDDLWFWGQESVCVEAWKVIKEFSAIMGLELNEEKTGTIQVTEDPTNAKPLPTSLPKGPVRWGFLRLDSSTGRWVVDNEQVAYHIDELRRQLSACRSVFAWVQAWNSYVSKFFGINFGKAANCMGRQHVDMVIQTFEHIQRQLFAGDSTGMTSRNVTEYLRQTIADRFGVADVPDGFFYFPVELGGLELQNPFVSLFGIYKRSFRSSMERIERAFEVEEQQYDKARKRYELGEYRPRRPYDAHQLNFDDEKFISFEEFTRFREETSTPLLEAYKNLMETPPEESVEATPRVTQALRVLEAIDWGTSGFNSQWYQMKHYWKWIVELHGGPMLEKFGGLRMGDKALLPIGLVSMLRSEKVRWQG